MKSLLDTYQFLERAWLLDSRLALASAVAVYDPQIVDDDDIGDYEIDALDRDQIVGYAIKTLRHVYPDLYADAISLRATGSPYNVIEQFIVKTLADMGWEYVDANCLASGYIPLYSRAINHFTNEVYEHYTEYQQVYELLKGDFPGDDYLVETGAYLVNSLDRRKRSVTLTNLRWTIAWLINSTGNTLLDISDEDIGCCIDLTWNPDDAAFALAAIQEANALQARIDAGLEHFNTLDWLRTALANNVSIIHAHLREKGPKNANSLDAYSLASLEWRHHRAARRKALSDA